MRESHHERLRERRLRPGIRSKRRVSILRAPRIRPRINAPAAATLKEIMATKTCDHCKEQTLIGTAVVIDGAQAHFYCLRDSCQNVFRAQVRNERDRLYSEHRLCRFKTLLGEPCGCEGKPAVTNGVCAAHAKLTCAYPGCSRQAVTECIQAIRYACDKPVCEKHTGCCDKHAFHEDARRMQSP
jgi:hypothetical protein